MSIDLTRINEAARALVSGQLVAFPTETVYGLGADAVNEEAVSRIYSVKGRPSSHPLIVHCSSLDAAFKWAGDFPEFAKRLAEEFWPGPMALVLQKSALAGGFITGGQDTVAVRVPSHPVALALLADFESLGGAGVAAPSANRFGKVSPTSASAVQEELGDFLEAEDFILDGGSSDVGIESTIIDCTGSAPRLLRLGAITASMVERATGLKLITDGQAIRVSGSHKSHYSPEAKVLLGAEASPGDGFLALVDCETPTGAVRLASPKNTEEFARVLYQALRKADSLALARVVVIPPAGDEISLAILDRLQRASY